ncbi:hypothetical protein PanWU01x14_044920, partial [Parasponia andersonii]
HTRINQPDGFEKEMCSRSSDGASDREAVLCAVDMTSGRLGAAKKKYTASTSSDRERNWCDLRRWWAEQMDQLPRRCG